MHCGERRVDDARDRQVVKANDRDIFRNADLQPLASEQSAQRLDIICAEDRRRGGRERNQVSRCLRRGLDLERTFRYQLGVEGDLVARKVASVAALRLSKEIAGTARFGLVDQVTTNGISY